MKEVFSNTINELGGYTSLIATECEKYGMTWGCNEDCPVLNDGKCQNYSSIDEYLEDKK